MTPKNKIKIIDIHAHLFNLKYLPIAGILRRFSNGLISPSIADGLEWFLIRKTESIYDLDTISFKEDSNELLYEKAGLLNVPFVKPIMELDEHDIKSILAGKLKASDIDNTPLQKALQEFQNEEAELIGEQSILFIQEISTKDMSQERALEIIGLFKRMIDKVMKLIERGVNYLKWFIFMTSSEERMWKRLSEVDAVGVDIFVHHMMDVDYFFRGNAGYGSYFDYEKEQIPNMQRITAGKPDRLIAFVAFNPARENCMDIIKDAIDNRGFKGVKFYPPMGYRAFDDENPVFRARIISLFDYCVEKDVPIFTHCNKGGFQAFPKKNSGHNSNPHFWESVLRIKKYETLRLCLAHAGGVEGWFSGNQETDEVNPDTILPLKPHSDDKQVDWNSSYSKIVYKLCLVYPNVYCDAAYLDEINKTEEYDEFKERLVKLFKLKPKFGERIIYGSDWHMLFQEGQNQSYLSDYVKLFNDKAFTPKQREDFFLNNAKAYLKLQF